MAIARRAAAPLAELTRRLRTGCGMVAVRAESDLDTSTYEIAKGGGVKTLMVAPQPFFSFRGTPNPAGARHQAALAGEWYRQHCSRETYTDKMRLLMARVTR